MLQSTYLSTNGIRLHAMTEGNGPLILFLHGFPDFWFTWRNQLKEFSQDHRVVALDLRGYNLSDKPKARTAYHIDELVKDIEGVLDSLGEKKCILVGHDWGGIVAWYFSYAHPNRVEKLIQLNIPHPTRFTQEIFKFHKQILRSWYMLFFQLPWLPEAILRAKDFQAFENIFTKQFINKNAVTPDDAAAHKQALSQPGSLTAMLNYYRNLPRMDFKKKLGRLDVPTLMIWGENDFALGKELTYGTEKFVNDISIRYIPRAGHWVHLEQPEKVNQMIREFLVQKPKQTFQTSASI